MSERPLDDVPAATGVVRRGVSICLFRDETVLLVKRGKAPGLGRWAPVGGHVEAGETAEAAARRELREETGLDGRLIGRCGEREIHHPDGSGPAMVLTVFAAAWIDGEPVAGDDAADARFVALDALDGIDLMPGVAPWIRAARALLDGFGG